MIVRLLNKGFLLWANKSYQRFMTSGDQLRRIQLDLLKNILQVNKDCSYGKDHKFGVILEQGGSVNNLYRLFQETVPIIESYSELDQYIQGYQTGEKNMLTTAEVIGFELTSGTSRFSKLIPYTKNLQNAFQEALAIWMCALAKSYPKAFHGPAFWSLSPAMKSAAPPIQGLPVGLNDEDYLGPFSRWWVNQTTVDTSDLNDKFENAEDFYDALIVKLLQVDLHFISIWSPTYLIQLMERIQNKWPFYLNQIKGKKRYNYLEKNAPACLNGRGLNSEFSQVTASALWPNLACISCWLDAQSGLWAADLNKVIGDVPLQGKGLLATEGITTIPIMGKDKLLAYTTQFFEFRCQETGGIYLADELVEGKYYEVLLSNDSGLYRYATNDLVKVKGYIKQIPSLEFIGRKGIQSDLVGEKLQESQILQAITQINWASKMLVIPKKNNREAYYEIITITPLSQVQQSSFVAVLKTNPYFKQALDAQQLSNLKFALWTKKDYNSFVRSYQAERKIKDGDFKMPVLITLQLVDEEN